MDGPERHQQMEFQATEQNSVLGTSTSLTYSGVQDTTLLCSSCKSNPIQIPYFNNTMAGILTPPDTPTSPFGFTMKPMFPPRLSEIQQASFFDSCVGPSDDDDDFGIEEGRTENLPDTGGMAPANQPLLLKSPRGHLKPRPNLRLRMNLGVQEPQGNEGPKDVLQEGLDVIEEEAQVTEEDEIIVDVELSGSEEPETHRETMMLYLIGSDLRRIADQFHDTYAREDGMVEGRPLRLNVPMVLTGCLSITRLSLAVGEVPVYDF